jgi:beta-glucanase (GH16 family)
MEKESTKNKPYDLQENKDWVLNDNMSDDFSIISNDSCIDIKWNINSDMNKFKGRGSMFIENNVKLENRKLILNTSKLDHEIDSGNTKYKYGSSILTSKNSIKYGFFEIKCKPNIADNMTSAFWLWSRKKSLLQEHTKFPHFEIDIFEIVANSTNYGEKTKNQIPTNIHPTVNNERKIYESKFKLDQEFYVYGLEWNKDSIRWLFNGETIRTEKRNDFDEPMFIVVDIEHFIWHGSINDESIGKSSFEIEYIKTWNLL